MEKTSPEALTKNVPVTAARSPVAVFGMPVVEAFVERFSKAQK